MSFGLGFYGAGDEISRKLDFEGHSPNLSEQTKQKIIQALSSEYPDILNCTGRDQLASCKWVINESQWLKTSGGK